MIEDLVHMEFSIKPITCPTEVTSSSLEIPLGLPHIHRVNLQEEPLIIPRIDLIDCHLDSEPFVRRESEGLLGRGSPTENIVSSNHRLLLALADECSSFVVLQNPSIGSSELILHEGLF